MQNQWVVLCEHSSLTYCTSYSATGIPTGSGGALCFVLIALLFLIAVLCRDSVQSFGLLKQCRPNEVDALVTFHSYQSTVCSVRSVHRIPGGKLWLRKWIKIYEESGITEFLTKTSDISMLTSWWLKRQHKKRISLSSCFDLSKSFFVSTLCFGIHFGVFGDVIENRQWKNGVNTSTVKGLLNGNKVGLEKVGDSSVELMHNRMGTEQAQIAERNEALMMCNLVIFVPFTDYKQRQHSHQRT